MAKVLIVEDTEVNRLVLAKRLEALGHEVLVAADGQEGLDKTKQELPDIVLMDLYLPVVDGTDVTRILKHDEQTKDIPIIALTAHSVTKGKEEIFDAGCDDYEMKPINFDRLTSKIDALVSKAN